MHTHTFATLELSSSAYNEIREKLAAAGYSHAFMAGGAIDMHGIAVTPPVAKSPATPVLPEPPQNVLLSEGEDVFRPKN